MQKEGQEEQEEEQEEQEEQEKEQEESCLSGSIARTGSAVQVRGC
jgi:hypothetical protein